MNELISKTSTLLPLPEANIVTRLATMDDLPFIDGLQKQHSKQLGFFPKAQWEGYIRNGWVVVAEEVARDEGRGASEDQNATPLPLLTPRPSPLATSLLGYCASRDRYLKRDELGAIFQLCVAPGQQRKFVGANLLRSVFERASYGCKLYCCWCAQDLMANRFWEAMGFVPLAFRAGSRGKSRVHIFWQKRIRARDDATPWWFPSQTNSGAIREDRIVLPIPPGTHWSDAKPMIYPELAIADLALPSEATKQLPGPRVRAKRAKAIEPAKLPSDITAGGLRFGVEAARTEMKSEKSKRAAKPKIQADPKLAAAARELRDRWLEKINGSEIEALSAKYELHPPMETPHGSIVLSRKLLAA